MNNVEIFTYTLRLKKKKKTQPYSQHRGQQKINKLKNRSGRCKNNSCYFPILKLSKHKDFSLVYCSHFSHHVKCFLGVHKMAQLVCVMHTLLFPSSFPHKENSTFFI